MNVGVSVQGSKQAPSSFSFKVKGLRQDGSARCRTKQGKGQGVGGDVKEKMVHHLRLPTLTVLKPTSERSPDPGFPSLFLASF